MNNIMNEVTSIRAPTLRQRRDQFAHIVVRDALSKGTAPFHR